MNHQQRKLQEEVFELQEAITRYESITNEDYTERGRIGHLKNAITEEMADVKVLLEELRFYYDIPWEDVNNVMVGKVERQLRRIDGERHN